jgi:hypothetical protein
MIKKIVVVVVVFLALPLSSFAQSVLWLKGDQTCFSNKQNFYKLARIMKTSSKQALILWNQMRVDGEVFTAEPQPVELVSVEGIAIAIRLQSGEQVFVERSSLDFKYIKENK